MIAPWLKQHLADSGAWNTDGIGRAAKVRRHLCGRHVITGLDDPRCAVVAIADVTPLSVLGEVLAVIDGRQTYNLVRNGSRAELDHRCPIRIAGSPPGAAGCDVVAEHRCLSIELPSMPTAYPETTTEETPDEPPY